MKPSLRLGLLLLLFHLAVAAVVLLTAMPLSARQAMLLPVLLSLLYYQARDVLLLLPDSWRDISFEPGNMSVVTRDGSHLNGQAANDTLVTSYFILLRIRPEGQRMPVARVIFPDAMKAGSFRELCIHLKFA